MRSKDATQNQIAKLAMSVVLVSCVFAQVSTPAYAQYAMTAESDSFLPPEVVPLDPQVAQKLAQSQAQARDMGMNVNGDPNQMNANQDNLSTAKQTRQNVMDSMMNQGSFQNEYANQNQVQAQGDAPGMVSQGAGGNAGGTSDWIMPGQSDSSAPMTAFGNVQQTQYLSAPSPHPVQRRDIRKSGMSHAVSALAGFGAGAVLGSVLRRPNTMMGLGMTSLMMTGLGTRNAFRF